MKVLLTGATGFIGRAFLARAGSENRFSLRAAVRKNAGNLPVGVESIEIEGLSASEDWREALKSCDVVVHTAARVHIMQDMADDPLAEFRRVNVDGTLNLARQAAQAKVRRFIFISTIKVNGETSKFGQPFRADDELSPVDPYAISKHEAEQGLRQLAEEAGMEVVIIRPPMVYGPEVKANFRSMIRWVGKGIPLPLGAIHNKRSFVAVDNLTDFIITCIEHPAAANQTFLVADGDDLSTTELLQRLGCAMGKPARLIPVPVGLLKLGATILGKRAIAQRLCGSLQVDIGKAREILGWTPPVSVAEGLRRAVRNL